MGRDRRKEGRKDRVHGVTVEGHVVAADPQTTVEAATMEALSRWATRCAASIAAGHAPAPLISDRTLSAYEAELSHRLLRRALARVGIEIDVPPNGLH